MYLTINGLLSEYVSDGSGNSESLSGIDKTSEVKNISSNVSTATSRSIEDNERLRSLDESRRLTEERKGLVRVIRDQMNCPSL